jgi:hypothetical protein
VLKVTYPWFSKDEIRVDFVKNCGGVDGEVDGVERGESVLCPELESPVFLLM